MARVNRKIRQGTVIKANQSKTVVVSVSRWTHHPLYGKALRRLKKYYVHDASDKCILGDLVQIEESRPHSKLKRWQVVEVLQHRDVPSVTPLELDMQDDTSVSPEKQGEEDTQSTDNGQEIDSTENINEPTQDDSENGETP